MANERRDLPTLRAYAKERAAVDPIPRSIWKSGFGTLFVLAFGIAGTWATWHFISPWLAFFGAIFSFAVAGGIASSVNNTLRAPRNERERLGLQVHKVLKNLANMGKNKIQTNVDPVAGQILEACAIQHQRIVTVLTSPAWSSRGTTEPWKSVRDQSLAAAEAAMAEAIVLGSQFIGPGQGSTEESEWSKVVTDFLDKGVGAALRRVDRILGPRPPLDPNQVPVALRPAFDVAMKMQALADEVDAASDSANAVQSAAGASLDQALQNLRAIQMAEEELDSTSQVQQRLQ